MKKRMVCLAFTALFSLCACQEAIKTYSRVTIAFDTAISTVLYEENNEIFNYSASLAKRYDKLFDSYESFEGINNIYSINHTNDPLVVDKELYDALKEAVSYIDITNGYFNPFIGKLSDAWKTSLEEEHILSSLDINTYIEEMNNTSLVFDDDNLNVQRLGSGEIDLGAFTKGYFLNKMGDYFSQIAHVNEFLLDCGSSSVLLGERPKTGYFNVGIKYLDVEYMKLKNTSIGVSAIYEQLSKINDQVYTHIVNPFTGSVQPEFDFVIVIDENPTLTDVLSTSFMSMSLNEIKECENRLGVEVVVSKNHSIIYHSESFKVYEFDF